MFNIGEILEAWSQSYAPDPIRKELAKLRYDVCRGCEYFGKRAIIGDEYCKDCGCPISKKVFSKRFNACPKKKWEDVDKIYKTSTTDKGDNTLI